MTIRRDLAAIGDVLLVAFPQHVPAGHEQEGRRPAVVVGLPDMIGPTRYPVMLVVPLTADRGQPWAARNPVVYPKVPAGSGGLSRNSIALLDQICSLTASRVAGYVGPLPVTVFQPITEGLRQILGGLPPTPASRP